MNVQWTLMSDDRNSGWKAFAGETLIGTAYFQRADQPWYICRFEPTAAFGKYRPTFDEYATLVNNPTEEDKHIDIGEYYEDNISTLQIRLEPFGNEWDGEVYVAQIYDSKECWIRPV